MANYAGDLALAAATTIAIALVLLTVFDGDYARAAFAIGIGRVFVALMKAYR